MDKRGRVSRFSVENFCHCADNFRWWEFFSVSLKSDIEKAFASEAYVTILDFLSQIFRLRVPKNFVGEPILLCFKNFGYRKCLDKRGSETGFSVDIYLCHSAEKFRG